MHFGSEQVLLGFESLRLAIYELFVERAAILHLLHAFTFNVLGCADFRFRCAHVQLRDQQLVINLMNAQGDVVLRLLLVRPCGVQVSARKVICRFDSGEQLSERLIEARSTRDNSPPTLIEGRRRHRNWGASYSLPNYPREFE